MGFSCMPPMETAPLAVPYIRFAEHQVRGPDFIWGPRRLHDHELIYVLRGQYRVELGSTEFVAPADHAFFFPSQTRHLFQAMGNFKEYEVIGIHFDWQELPDSAEFEIGGPATEILNESWARPPQLIPDWDIEVMPVLNLRGRTRVRALLHEVTTVYSTGGKHSMVRAGALLQAALAQLAHEAYLLRDVAANTHFGADAVRRVHHARELLEVTRLKPMLVGEVAAEVGWSADHLGRMCRAVLGVSPYRLQTLARLRRAKQLLRQNVFSVTEIAHACGFKDACRFMTTFKRETGMTARQYAALKPGDERLES